MNTRARIAGVLLVATVVMVASTGIGFAAPGPTQALAGPSTSAVGTQQHAQVQQQTQSQQCTFPSNETYESFDVTNLSAPSTVQPGDTVTVTADISNPNDAPLVQCVEFRLEGDVVERRGWALNPNETETITFEVDTTGLEEGTYIHGVQTRDMGEVTTLTVSSEPPATASLQFDDQTTDGASVVVANANLSEGGYIAILDENGSVLGATEYLEPGEQENVTVDLAEPLTENATLTAQAHLDTNDNQTLDFLTSNGTEDGPYVVDGEPVTDTANVTVEEEEEEPEPTATLQFDDQTTDGSSVVVANANLSDGGYIAILDENGSVLGATEYLEPGEQENVTVDLAESLTENATLTAQAHVDSNDNQVLDFLTSNGTEDGPYMVDGEPVTDTANVTVEEEAPPEETETPTEETETPTEETETPTEETETPTEETETPTEETETPTEETETPVEETETPTEETETPVEETETPTEETETPTEETETPVEETETPTEETETATVQFDDQMSGGTAVLVTSANLSDGGFIAIHDESGDIIGASGYLEPGETMSIAVTLDEPLSESATLTAMPHFDTNDNENLDFVDTEGAEDGPYTMDGEPITDDAEVTVQGNASSDNGSDDSSALIAL